MLKKTVKDNAAVQYTDNISRDLEMSNILKTPTYCICQTLGVKFQKLSFSVGLDFSLLHNYYMV